MFQSLQRLLEELIIVTTRTNNLLFHSLGEEKDEDVKNFLAARPYSTKPES